jgi:hypothetical protein
MFFTLQAPIERIEPVNIMAMSDMARRHRGFLARHDPRLPPRRGSQMPLPLHISSYSCHGPRMRSTRKTALIAILAFLLAAGPGLGHADEGDEAGATAVETPTPIVTPSSSSGPALRPRLTLDLPTHATITGGLLVVSGVAQLMADRLVAPACRWCEPNQLDRWARHELRWTNANTAGNLSNVLVIAVPIGAALTLGLSAHANGAEPREMAEDLVVVTEAVSIATILTQVSKFSTGRLRPESWAKGDGGTTTNSLMSFWGGHCAFVFSVAAAATQVARLRGQTNWKWLALASFTGAAAVGWLRVAADKHWLTDVVVGAGVGTAVGLAVPLLVLRPADERAPAVTLVPTPGGLAVLF